MRGSQHRRRQGAALTLPGAITAVALFLLLLAAPVHADVITLKNGNRIRGRILARSGGNVLLELPYGHMSIPDWQVDTVEAEDNTEYLRKTGTELIDLRDGAKGLDLLREAHRQDPRSESTRRALHDGLVQVAEESISARRLVRADALLAEARKLQQRDGRREDIERRLAQERGTLAALEQRAHEAEDQRDIDGFYKAVKELLDLYAEEREKWAEPFAQAAAARGHAAFEQEHFDEACDFYHEALRSNPDMISILHVPLVYAELRTVVPLLEKGDFPSARQRLDVLADLLPSEPAVLFYLALACEGSGDLAEAARLFGILAGPEHRTIHGPRHLAELRARAEERLLEISNGAAPTDPRWRGQEGGKQDTLEGEHFVIHHTNIAQAREVDRYLEHHLRRLRREWFTGQPALELGQKIAVHVHPTRDVLLARGSASAWSDGVTLTVRRFGLIRSQEIHFNASAHQFLSSVLPHELAHAILPHRIGPSVQLPLWIDEGMATLEEAAVKQEYFVRVARDACRGNEHFPLEELMAMKSYPSGEARVQVFYAQSSSLLRYLRDRLGRRRLFALITTLATEGWTESVRRDTGFDTPRSLEREWRAWLLKDPS